MWDVVIKGYSNESKYLKEKRNGTIPIFIFPLEIEMMKSYTEINI